MSTKITIEKTSILVNNVSSKKGYFLFIKELTYLPRFLFIELILLLAIPAGLSLFIKNNQTPFTYGYYIGNIIVVVMLIFLIILAGIALLLFLPILLLINYILTIFSIHYVIPPAFYVAIFILMSVRVTINQIIHCCHANIFYCLYLCLPVT